MSRYSEEKLGEYMDKNETKPNGTVTRILQFGQMLVLGAVLPWGVWVTGQIYALNTEHAQFRQWKDTREKSSIATMTDVELARLKTKDELQGIISAKLDDVIKKLNELDVKLTRHEASAGFIKP
jgi:hypothetical protein